eukprot:CAMPEP_0194397200 /NCGR_PEP_ID=MMETSP0174-20130528/125417_1 /TAXON_ID=216777 /ORGANISM="Proboscia alata, Strain PI-D3" /LENGTH=235 /DNA_ID=CAMNT_0039193359 /DNA_START=31 /DNA_END=738 /DNA_ORIENTATION=+
MKRVQQLNFPFLLLLILAQHIYVSTSFTPTPFNAFQQFFNNPSSIFRTNEKNTETKRVDELKKALLTECRTNNGSNNRAEIEELIQELKEIRPIEGTAISPLLQKEWLLVWTTEKEINLFIDWNISGDITQTIQNNVLTNDIQFQKGGSLSVIGSLGPNDGNEEVTNSDDSTNENNSNSLIRTNFEFESATLDLAKWGSYNFPPLGKGWFDTVFLDEELRVDLNSRDDILICTSK